MTVRYRIMNTPGFKDLRSNFYNDLPVALELIRHAVEEQGRAAASNDFKNFLSMNLERPDPSDRSATNRWKRKASIFRSILLSAGYIRTPRMRRDKSCRLVRRCSLILCGRGILHGILDAANLGNIGPAGSEEDLTSHARRISASGRSAAATIPLPCRI